MPLTPCLTPHMYSPSCLTVPHMHLTPPIRWLQHGPQRPDWQAPCQAPSEHPSCGSPHAPLLWDAWLPFLGTGLCNHCGATAPFDSRCAHVATCMRFERCSCAIIRSARLCIACSQTPSCLITILFSTTIPELTKHMNATCVRYHDRQAAPMHLPCTACCT